MNPIKREWVGLTDEEILDAHAQACALNGGANVVINHSRLIESMLREKLVNNWIPVAKFVEDENLGTVNWLAHQGRPLKTGDLLYTALIDFQQKEKKLEELEINGVKWIRADSISYEPSSLQIVVLDRGFVYIGSVSTDGDMLIVKNAYNIRKWGTTKGLGELVNGPLSDTQLDKVGTVRAPVRALISLIDVVPEKWKGI